MSSQKHSSEAHRTSSTPDNCKHGELGNDWGTKSQIKFSRQGHLPQTSSWVNHSRSFIQNPYSQQNIVQKPVAVCFVCGNSACEEKTVLLYSRSPRSQPDAPFFPFLEYHDPAPGAANMKDDWSVVSCSVCSALLSQQWKSFEKGRMPISKRLYWLKRPSGCEIRQPVSQIELEEILNEHSKDNYEEKEESESDEEVAEPRIKRKRSDSLDYHQREKEPIVFKSKAVSRESSIVIKNKPLLCYSCGKGDISRGSIFPIHCKPSYEQIRTGVPFYPSVLTQSGVTGCTVLYDSITFLCKHCFPKYKPQWHPMQKHILESKSIEPGLIRIPLPEAVSCYLCGDDVSTKFNGGLVHSSSHLGKKNSLHKKLSLQKPVKGSVPLSCEFTYLCPNCHSRLIVEEKVDKSQKK